MIWKRSRGKSSGVSSKKLYHNIPFSPIAQTTKNVGVVITCVDCCKSRLLHSKNEIKKEDLKGVKRIVSKLTHMCESVEA